MLTETKKKFFQVGSSLTADFPSYIERQADVDLYNNLNQGAFCFVLTARQMGKSSLKNRMMRRLEREGWVALNVDLSQIGSIEKTEYWYFSFLSFLSDKIIDSDEFEDWWDSKTKLTSVARMSLFWEELLVKATEKKIAIFIDEIDTLLSVDNKVFNKDDFFAAIRSVYNKRDENKVLKRLNFSIIGVAAPLDLMSASERTPFNIGVPIQVLNFKEEEALPLKKGLGNNSTINEAILKRIIYWTSGQPFLTQQLGQFLSEQKCTSEEVKNVVDSIVKEIYFKKDILNEVHFNNIERRVLNNKTLNIRMLDKYRLLLKNGDYAIEDKEEALLYLKLSGLVREENAIMYPSNRIYTEIFNEAWLEKAFETIDRPITMARVFWENSNRSKDALLTGEILQQAVSWKTGRIDLSTSEEDFIKASQLAEQEVEAAKELAEQEARAEKILQENKERQRKRLIWALIGTILFLLIAIGSAIYANDKRKLAERETGRANKERIRANKGEEDAKENLNNFIITRTQKDSSRFYFLAIQSKNLTIYNECPEKFLPEMINIACDYPKNLRMKDVINEILSFQKCQLYNKNLNNPEYQKLNNINPNCL